MLSGGASIFISDPYETHSVDVGHIFGTIGTDKYGNLYQYAKAGAANISRGKLQLAPAAVANHKDLAVTNDVAIGATKVTATLGATAATINQYAGGSLTVIDGTGEGQRYTIVGNPAANTSATLEVTLERPIEVALDNADSKVDLAQHHCNGVVEAAAGAARKPIGVPLVNVTAAYYFWAMGRGRAAVLADEALTDAAWLVPGTDTAGSVEELDDVSSPLTEFIVGRTYNAAGTDTEYPTVDLMIL